MRAGGVFALFDLDFKAFPQWDPEVNQKCRRRHTLYYAFDPFSLLLVLF